MIPDPASTRSGEDALSRPANARTVERQLRRLEALAARHRRRTVLRRALRGFLGGGGSLAALVKLKLVGSLAGKLALAGLIGLGFAWPALALALVLIGVALLAISEGDAPEACDCGDCARKESRRARLDRLIAERVAQLGGGN